MARIEKPILRAQGEARWHRPDAQKLLARIGHYTRFVSFSKILLSGMSLLLIGMIVALPLLHGDKEGIRLALGGVQETTANNMPVMKNPTFQGVNERNQPYYVTADAATQLSAHEIRLSNVRGDMLTEDDAWLSVKAQKGLINNESKQMQLLSDVRLIHQDGYEFVTQSVQIDMAQRIARGQEPVAGRGPVGQITANGFEWEQTASILRFNGNVKMRVTNTNAR